MGKCLPPDFRKSRTVHNMVKVSVLHIDIEGTPVEVD